MDTYRLFTQISEIMMTEEIKKRIAPNPTKAIVELTNICNHACVFCANPAMERKPGSLQIDVYKKFIEEVVPNGVDSIAFHTTGETLVHKGLEEYVDVAVKAGIGYVYITTNGALADIERMKGLIKLGVNSIKFSLNAPDRESYRLTHGKDEFDKVMKNLRDLSEYRNEFAKDVKLMTSIVVTKFTEDKIDLYKETMEPLVDEVMIVGVNSCSGLISNELEYLHSPKFSPEAPVEGKAEPCDMLWDRVHLTQEGELSLCCADFNNDLIYGDLNTGTVSDAWNNDLMTSMRQRHLDQDLKGSLCHNCLYNSTEKYEPIMKSNHRKYPEAKELKGKKGIMDRIEKLSEIK